MNIQNNNIGNILVPAVNNNPNNNGGLFGDADDEPD